MSLFLILLAAGDSKRFKSKIPKPFHKVNNQTLLEYSINEFKGFPEIKKIFVVYNKKHKKLIDKISIKEVSWIKGGSTRQKSTYMALKKIKKLNCKKIIIHDCARPGISKELIKNLIKKLKKNNAVIPVIKTYDATKRIKKKTIFKNINRNNLMFAQTPQGFSFKDLYKLHTKNKRFNFDDDSALFTYDNQKVTLIKGKRSNFKITDREDLLNFQLSKRKEVFFGIGFDVHKFAKNKKLYLGGVKIPFKYGLEGHSDADPVLHALIDSILGAIRKGDIGKLFSNKNKIYKNIRSTKLLKIVVDKILSRKYSINNIDINIITEKPNIQKYRKKIIKSISKICKVSREKISVKGKTAEKLGLIGKEKAIASEVITSIKQNA